jgi:uncharacterized Zn finger protein (UPF0148 family)
MPVDLCCPACGEPLHRPSRSAHVRCPRCKSGFVAPAAEPADHPERRRRSRPVRRMLAAGSRAWRAATKAIRSLWKRPRGR